MSSRGSRVVVTATVAALCVLFLGSLSSCAVNAMEQFQKMKEAVTEACQCIQGVDVTRDAETVEKCVEVLQKATDVTQVVLPGRAPYYLDRAERLCELAGLLEARQRSGLEPVVEMDGTVMTIR